MARAQRNHATRESQFAGSQFENADSEHEASRKPAETPALAGAEPGDWVLELASGKGYFTRLLSAGVAAHGQVTSYIISKPQKPGAPPLPIQALAAGPHYSSMKVYLQWIVDVKSTNSFDLVWTTQTSQKIHNLEGLDVAG